MKNEFEGLPKLRMEYVGIEEEFALDKISKDGFYIQIVVYSIIQFL